MAIARQDTVRYQPAHHLFEVQRIASGLPNDALVQFAVYRLCGGATEQGGELGFDRIV